MKQLPSLPQESEDKQRHRYRHQLSSSLTPSYKQLFEDVSKLENGVGFLIEMRKDLLVSEKYYSDVHYPYSDIHYPYLDMQYPC